MESKPQWQINMEAQQAECVEDTLRMGGYKVLEQITGGDAKLRALLRDIVKRIEVLEDA